MKHRTASTSPSPFSGENWFDPLEDAIRFPRPAFMRGCLAESKASAAIVRARYQLSGAPKGYRNGHRHRQLDGDTSADCSLPRVRLLDGDGGDPWRSQPVQAGYEADWPNGPRRLSPMRDLAGTNTAVSAERWPACFKVGQDGVSFAPGQGKDRLGELAGSGLARATTLSGDPGWHRRQGAP